MKFSSEKGYALPIVMIVILVGALVVPPFLGHTSSSLIASRVYGQEINAEYAADAGIEQAIWNLVDGGIAGSLSDPGDAVSYNLPVAVNDLTPAITIYNASDDGYDYAITANAGGRTIKAAIDINDGVVTILSWNIL